MHDINWRPDRKTLRWFFALWGPLAATALGGWVGAATGAWSGVAIFWASFAALCGVGFLFPERMKWVFLGWMLFFWPVGWLVSNTLLATIYFLVVTPIGLALRLAGRDVLRLKSSRAQGETTAWEPRATPVNAEQYFRQH